MKVYENDERFTVERDGVEYLILSLYGRDCCSVVRKDADPNIVADVKFLKEEGIADKYPLMINKNEKEEKAVLL